MRRAGGTEGAEGARGIGAGGGTGATWVVGIGGAVTKGFLLASPALNALLSAIKIFRTCSP